MIAYHDQRRLVGNQILAARDASLARLVADLGRGGPTLYVGAKPGRAHYLDRFERPLIVEASAPNVRALRELGLSVVQGDVRTFTPDRRFKTTFWWHGPEHVAPGELAHALALIESYTEELVVLGCPWGDYPQGAVGGNEYEVHRQAIEPTTLEALGYCCDVTGAKGVGSNITAVKRAIQLPRSGA